MTSNAPVTPEPLHYDAVMVGGNPAGLLTAGILARNGLKVALVDLPDALGGRWGNAYWHGYWLDFGQRDAKDTFSDNYLATTPSRYFEKAAEAAGVRLNVVGPLIPSVLVHEPGVGVFGWDGNPEAVLDFTKNLLGISESLALQFLQAQGGLAQLDEYEYMDTLFEDWLNANVTPDLHDAFERSARILYSGSFTTISLGRWIHFQKNPVVTCKINDPETGGHQGAVEALANAIRKNGGDIYLGLMTEEISVKDDKVTGIVARDKANVIQEFYAPVVVFCDPSWAVLDVLNRRYLSDAWIEDVLKVKEAYSGSDLFARNLGLSRLPTIRATGKPEDQMCWNQFTQHLPDGWYVPSLSSGAVAPEGKHLISMVVAPDPEGERVLFGSFEEAKVRFNTLHDYMREYYSDLDEVTEWTNYQWYRVWPTSSYWQRTRRPGIQLDGVEGMYFAGATVEVAGVYQDVEANSALQAAEAILQARKP